MSFCLRNFHFCQSAITDRRFQHDLQNVKRRSKFNLSWKRIRC